MGLLDGLMGGRMKDPVRGMAQVVSCSAWTEGIMQNCHMNLIVHADGVPATAVELNKLVHNQKWPSPGMTLPVTVDRANPQKVKVEWDELQDSRDRTRQSAEDMAAAMRGEEPAAGLGGAQVINLSGSRPLGPARGEEAEAAHAGHPGAGVAGGAGRPGG